MQRKVKEALRSYGLEVVGGGISNLMPQDDKVMQRRIKNWQTKWQSKIQSRMSEGQAGRALLIEGAKAEAERMSTQYLTEIIKSDSNDGNKSHNTAVLLQFLKALRGFNTAKN